MSSASGSRTTITAATDSDGWSDLADSDPPDEALVRADDGDDSHGEDADPAGSDDNPTSDTEGDEVGGLATVAAAGADDEDAVEIVVGQCELDSNTVRILSKREDLTTRLGTLAVGDYVLSDYVTVEQKSVSDFLGTLMGGGRSIFEQITDLTCHYIRSLPITEGRGLHERRNIHSGTIRRALSSVTIDPNISVLFTEGEDDTVKLLAIIATREQANRERTVNVHDGKSVKTLDGQQKYVVSVIVDVGPVTARTLLEVLGNVEVVTTANEEDLKGVRGIGQVTAERVREVVSSEYR